MVGQPEKPGERHAGGSIVMTELKFGYDDAYRQTRLHRNTLKTILTISSPMIMVALLLFLPKEGQFITYARLLVPPGIFAICGACFYYGWRLGTERMNLTTTYLFTGTELIRRRRGWPDDRIALNETDAVIYDNRSIVVTSTAHERRFIIPDNFEGFASLVRELEKAGRLKRQSQSNLRAVFFVAIVVCCWLAILLSHEKQVTEIASILIVISLAYSSYRIIVVKKRATKMEVKPAMWFLIGLAWAVTLVLVYSKFLGG
jgi:hypothetical protein